jgi:signal transduction histidine kinase
MGASSVLSRGITFVRRNPSIFYSLSLIVVVTGVIFWNSYYSLGKFQKSTDSLIQGKALLAERLFEVFAEDLVRDPETLSEKIQRIREKNPDISNIVVFTKSDEEGFRSIASTDSEDMEKIWNEPFHFLAWSQEEGVAFLSNDQGKRFWNVLKQIRADSGEKIGLVLFQLSLEENDAFISAEIRKVYFVAIISLLFVLLILANHLRFFRYAIRATELEEIDKMKDDFVSMASHELKSPITILRGYIDLMKDSASESEIRGHISKMDMTLERLSTLVEDLLNVSRLEQDRLPIDMKPTDLREILRPIADDFSILAKEKNIAFSYSDADLPRGDIVADPERMKQILVNLLSNAVKYTKEGSVGLSVSEKGNDVIITVADTGFGISAEDMGHLFGKFYRVRNVETDKIPGTGLGLWIAREIARKMGGDLTAESIRGVGSHFSLRLKKAEDDNR